MRIKKVFGKCTIEGRKAFVAYIAAGDPDFGRSLDVVDALVDGGVDILELGVPFSDPLADGEANQLAAARALDSGMTPRRVLEFAAEIRRKYPSLPLVLFTYLNPVAYSEELPFDKFCAGASEAGIDAVLPLDLPPEESASVWKDGRTFRDIFSESGLSLVTLIAPTSPPERIPELVANTGAFVYYVSKEGVTGEGNSFSANFAENISLIKSHTSLPVVVGFGISSPEHVREAVSTGVDGVVVGSAIVRKVEAFAQGEISKADIRNFVVSLTDAAR